MNILYILGNGFDKAQGLNTCYTDFYKDYMTHTPESKIEARVMSDISSNYDTWADMEIAMGQYSAKWDNVEDFRKVIKLLNRRLKEYLKKEENRIEGLHLSKEKLTDDILQPTSGIEPFGKMLIKESLSISHPFTINCVSFNYTNTLETILGFSRGVLTVRRDYSDTLSSILHIHGVLGGSPILGVNDISQIANEGFRENKYFVREFVKPMYNAGCQNDRALQFSRFIKEANIIVLMGTSIGITDSIWWNQIGKELTKYERKLLILFYPYDPNKNTIENECFKDLWAEEYISLLKERMGLEMDLEVLKTKIFVGINKDFLKLAE